MCGQEWIKRIFLKNNKSDEGIWKVFKGIQSIRGIYGYICVVYGFFIVFSSYECGGW